MAVIKKLENNERIHIDDIYGIYNLTNKLASFIKMSEKKEAPHILCIGTDRSTGDSLGPLTGWRLRKLLYSKDILVFGTIDEPVHAQNLESVVKSIQDLGSNHSVIAVDACLGHHQHVETILLEPKPLKPGAGVNKNLPEVGDISISGIVNVSGFMEYQILQSTRLSLVMKMSQIISNSIFLALQKTGYLNQDIYSLRNHADIQ